MASRAQASASKAMFKPSLPKRIVAAAQSYLDNPDEYEDGDTLTVHGCQCCPKAGLPQELAVTFLIGEPGPVNAFVAWMRKEGVGLVEAVEGGAFERALHYSFPGVPTPPLPLWRGPLMAAAAHTLMPCAAQPRPTQWFSSGSRTAVRPRRPARSPSSM